MRANVSAALYSTIIRLHTETRDFQFNVIDALYLLYLILIGVLAYLAGGSWNVMRVHAAMAAVILVLAALSSRSKMVRFIHDWYPLLMFIFCFEEVARYSLSIVPHWQDAHLIKLERLLFPVSPNVWLNRFATHWVSEVMDVGYFSYYTMFMIVGGKLYTWREKRPFEELMLSTVIMYFLAYTVYLLFPTEGPAHTMPAMSNTPHGAIFNFMVRLIQHHAGVHGNAFPSAHVASAFISVFFAWKYLPRLGLALTPFFVLIGISSVYDNYHYVSDVAGGIMVAVIALMIAWGLFEGY